MNGWQPPFEVVETFRKLFLVGLPVLFEEGSVPQLFFALGVCFGSWGILQQTMPYDAYECDVVARASQIQACHM